VSEIKAFIDEQRLIENQIQAKQKKISSIIENAINN
jgi:hypothetical protein